MNITPDLIHRLAYSGMPDSLCNTWSGRLNVACTKAQINTPQRAAHFLAQITHESGGLKWMEELWGPTPAQVRYEGRLDLGNTEQGDGYRYRGRGPLQLTGRANYRATGQRLGSDLERYPDLAAQIGVGSLVAGDYWTHHGLNRLADQGGLVMVPAITRVVNGGENGLPDRQRRYSIAAHVLGL